MLFKRHIYLIDKKMQLKYALMIGGILGVMLVLVEFHTYLTIQAILPNLLSSSFARQIKQIQMWLIINGVIYTAVVAGISIFISHKIAGPVFKLKKQIREIIDSGNTAQKIFIRKGDELQDLVVELNNLLDRVEFKK